MSHIGPPRRLLLALCISLAAVGCQFPPKKLSEEQIAALREIGFHRQGGNWGIDLDDGRILFDNNETGLSAKNRATIASIVKTLKKVGISHIIVEGHTSNVGNENYNIYLSLRRARTVAREIARNGLPYRNIDIKGYGMTNPISDNATQEGRAQNRRVVLIVPME
ncbi:MAG: OmpA family protein [Azoarcus sp.]|nr:OmpA family protein [Azoarcus sp.]